MSQVQGIDIRDFVAKKESGHIATGRTGNTYFMSVKRYDPATGKEADSQLATFKIDQIVAAKADLQKQMDDLDAVIEDLKSLE